MKFIIMHNAGYGETTDVIEADNQEEADKIAYENWREEAESNAYYWAKPLTKELVEAAALVSLISQRLLPLLAPCGASIFA